jgi:hypothetical protein
MRAALILFSLFASLSGYSKDGNYSVTLIPKELLKNANVVKRMEEIRFEVINTGETVLYRKYALTILNEAGDEHAGFYEWYDKLQSIRSIEGNLYDMMGNELKKVKNKDIQDMSGTSGIDVADDRVKAHNFYYKVYPYTVEYEVEVRFNHSFYFPSWMPQRSGNLSVEKSNCIIITPTDYNIRYKVKNYNGEPSIKTEKGKKIMQWQVSNLSAIEKQFAAPTWSEIATSVSFAPTEFALGNYKGDMSNWKEFGKFIYALKKDRDQLPDEMIQKVQQLTSGISNDKEKIKLLYEFMQQHTRYISIQLGIGGWQPFDAAFVAKKGYGDCKALSNYMYSLLKAAGIKSFYTLVNAGSDFKNRQMMTDFPSNQFNHVILCAPLQKDTMWLECTSQSLAAGYMGDHTGNRKALVIDEDGGTIVSTPRYGLQENLQLRSIKGKVDETGTMEVGIKTIYTGLQQERVHDMLTYLSKDKVKKALNEEFDNLSTYDINNFKYEEKKQVLPSIDEDLDITVSNYATLSGRRLFIYPNILNRGTTRLSDTAERKYDYVFDMAWHDADTVTIELPEGYIPESMPQDISLKTKFGSYTSSAKLQGNKLNYLRVREQYAGRFPAKDKEELSKFYEAIYKADRTRVVLVKKD